MIHGDRGWPGPRSPAPSSPQRPVVALQGTRQEGRRCEPGMKGAGRVCMDALSWRLSRRDACFLPRPKEEPSARSCSAAQPQCPLAVPTNTTVKYNYGFSSKVKHLTGASRNRPTLSRPAPGTCCLLSSLLGHSPSQTAAPAQARKPEGLGREGQPAAPSHSQAHPSRTFLQLIPARCLACPSAACEV